MLVPVLVLSLLVENMEGADEKLELSPAVVRRV